MKKRLPQEDIEKKIRDNAAENYLEAGRSLNTILASSVILILAASFALDLPSSIISSGYVFTIASVFLLTFHKMRQMYLFRKTLEDENLTIYEEQEKFILNIPQFLFYSYISFSITLIILFFGIILGIIFDSCQIKLLRGI